MQLSLVDRCEQRDGPTTVSHLERFPLLDSSEPAACVLSKFPDPDTLHVLQSSTWYFQPLSLSLCYV